jgi:hypothetical protein
VTLGRARAPMHTHPLSHARSLVARRVLSPSRLALHALAPASSVDRPASSWSPRLRSGGRARRAQLVRLYVSSSPRGRGGGERAAETPTHADGGGVAESVAQCSMARAGPKAFVWRRCRWGKLVTSRESEQEIGRSLSNQSLFVSDVSVHDSPSRARSLSEALPEELGAPSTDHSMRARPAVLHALARLRPLVFFHQIEREQHRACLHGALAVDGGEARHADALELFRHPRALAPAVFHKLSQALDGRHGPVGARVPVTPTRR